EQQIEVAVVSLSLEREKALNIALNNAQVGSDWDLAKLADLVGELAALPDFDVTLTGFDERDVRDLNLAPDAKRASSDPVECDGDHVEVLLEVPRDEWDTLRPALDEFLFAHPLRVHVKNSPPLRKGGQGGSSEQSGDERAPANRARSIRKRCL